jgi:hypothetical protein
MLCYFVSDTHMVITALILIVFVLVWPGLIVLVTSYAFVVFFSAISYICFPVALVDVLHLSSHQWCDYLKG